MEYRRIVAILPILAAATAAAAPAPQWRNAVLIGWDGAQRAHVKERLAANGLPSLRALADSGSIVEIDITRTTDTKSGWAQILTGYHPEVTGVFSNGRFDAIPKGLSIFERLRDAFGKSFVNVAVIGKKGHVDAEGEERIPAGSRRFKRMKENGNLRQGRIVEEGGRKYLLINAKPWFNAAPTLDVWENGLTLNDKVGARALELLDKYGKRRFFFFVHFAQIDGKGHQFGENSPEYDAALDSADTWTGRIMEKLKKLGIAETTFVCVTADHGFDEDQKGHADAPYVFLASNDRRIARRGLREDIAPTVMAELGVDLAALKPPLDGHPLTEPHSPPAW